MDSNVKADKTSSAGTLDENTVVRLAHVGKQYDSLAENQPPVLDDVNLAVKRGESAAITGPSGSGKTTLLNIIGGLDEPTSGSVHAAGVDPTMLNSFALATWRNRQIGFVFQLHHLLPQCTAVENVLIPTLADSSRDRREAARLRAEELLARVGLADRMHHRPGELSGGERQRVALVRALINQPALLLADEPTGALDRPRALEMAQLLVDLNCEHNVTLILVTHDPQLASMMQRTLRLCDGRLQSDD